MKYLVRPLCLSMMAVALVSALGSAALFPASARAAQAGSTALPSGEAKGENGLTAQWKILRDMAGKEKTRDDGVWLVVTPALKGKELPSLSLEVGDNLVDMWPDAVVFVTIGDYNFDGHDDLRLTEDAGMTSTSGPVYLFNSKDSGFVESEAFKKLSEPEIDAKRKRITSHERGSACDHTIAEYAVTGFDQLELVAEEGLMCPPQLQLAGDYAIEFKRRYKNGELVSQEGSIDKSKGSDAEDYSLFTGKNIYAPVPKGWEAKEDRDTVVIDNPKKPELEYVRAFTVDLPSADQGAFVESARKIASVLQGKNLEIPDGEDAGFDLEDGARVRVAHYGKTALVTIVSEGESEEPHTIAESMLLLSW